MTQQHRHYHLIDRFCMNLDQVLRTLANHPIATGKTNPANNQEEANLSDQQRAAVAGMMRVNHAGEICAQALYHGQRIASSSKDVSAALGQAALEEGDHLSWCSERLNELGSHTSYLNPLWYGGSFCLGLVAGMVGDQWSLGFVAETERQVIKHLESHLDRLPKEDARSHVILKQMEEDEAKHRDEAIANGAKELPNAIKKLMALTAKVMVKTTYWI